MMLISVKQAECKEGMIAIETALRERNRTQQPPTGIGELIEPTFSGLPKSDRFQMTEPVVAATASLRG